MSLFWREKSHNQPSGQSLIMRRRTLILQSIFVRSRPRYVRSSRRRNIEPIKFELSDSVKGWFLTDF